uniref:Metaxin-1 n=1 Tax=Pelusios castaneus TaxID=367368 RepID=A0A8C8SS33_9SAUR
RHHSFFLTCSLLSNQPPWLLALGHLTPAASSRGHCGACSELPLHRPETSGSKPLNLPSNTDPIHTFWVDAKNYVEHTWKWYAEAMPFPLNFFLPNCMHKRQLQRLQLMWGDSCLEDEEELEKEMYREALECLTLLSQRLGDQKFFFGDSPASLDVFVFSHLAPLLKAKLPNGKLQQHLKSLQNLCDYCTSILSLYFPWDGGDAPSSTPKTSAAEGTESEEEPHKRRNQILSVLVGLATMIGYAFLSGIVSIQWGTPGASGPRPIALEEEEDEEE